jgi:hypothetical protein
VHRNDVGAEAAPDRGHGLVHEVGHVRFLERPLPQLGDGGGAGLGVLRTGDVLDLGHTVGGLPVGPPDHRHAQA